jgi:hypothetical protein
MYNLPSAPGVLGYQYVCWSKDLAEHHSVETTYTCLLFAKKDEETCSKIGLLFKHWC